MFLAKTLISAIFIFFLFSLLNTRHTTGDMSTVTRYLSTFLPNTFLLLF